VNIPIYSIKLVREGTAGSGRAALKDSRAVQEFGRELLADLDREQFWVLLLDTKNRVIGANQVAVGTLDACLVHPREVFKAAVAASAASIIVLHNHPSGDPSPSREDRELTRRLAEAGRVLGIPVLDHVVIGQGAHFSFKDAALL